MVGITMATAARTRLLVAALATTAVLTAGAPAAHAFTNGGEFASPGWIDGPNKLAADNNGDAFALRVFNIPGSDFGAAFGYSVQEISRTGQVIRAFPSTFEANGNTLYVVGANIAATPNGAVVVLVGGDSSDGDSSKPFVGEYSTATGQFLRGLNFDLTPGVDTDGVAVDPSGQHIFVLASAATTEGNVYEFNISNLAEVREFPLNGNHVSPSMQPSSITVGGPDNDVYVTVGAEGTHSALVQQYTSSGTFERQFVTSGGGVAVNRVGDVFSAGDAGSFRIEEFDPTGHLLELQGEFTGLPVVETINGQGELFVLESDVPGGPRLTRLEPHGFDTKLTSHPRKTTKLTNVSFGFKATGSTFECRLQKQGVTGTPFTPCKSPATFKNLPAGKWTFTVRSVSFDGITDQTPAKWTFSVKPNYVYAVITSSPAARIGSSQATFAFKGTKPGTTFKCLIAKFLLTAGKFRPCTSPITYHHLTNELYAFDVEAISKVGVIQPTPTLYTFTVDTTPPQVTVPQLSVPINQVAGTTGTLNIQETWTGSDVNNASSPLLFTLQERSGSSASSLGSYAAVPGAHRVAGLTSHQVAITPADGTHRFRAVVRNVLGNSAVSKAGRAFSLSLVEDNSSSVAYSGSWIAPLADSAAIGGTVEAAQSGGSTATLHFTGTGIGVVAVPGPLYGKMKVCVDPATSHSSCTTIDTDAPSAIQRDLVYFKDKLPAGSHTLQVTQLSSKPIVLDAFEVLSQTGPT
jgi:hypothetical protein